MENNVIEKSNILNSMQKAKYDMTLNEFRLFCLYLSKLNARNPSERTATIKIKDFEELFDVSFNTSRFNQKIHQVAGANIEIKEGKRTTILQLYSKFEWCDDDEHKELRVTCNYDVQPYLFELQKNYTSYKLGNIAKLNALSKIRLYELMKQYEKMRSVEIAVEDLQSMLMSKENEFKFFRLRVVDPAVKDINEFTDITVRYEKVLRCRKCTALRFFISGKPAEKEVIEVQATEVQEPELDEKPSRSSKPKTLEELYMKYFSGEQLELLTAAVEAALQDYPDTVIKRETPAILRDCIGRFTEQKRKKTIKSDYGYMSTIIFKATEEYKKKHKPQSYDIDEFEKFAINYDELQKSI